jgi:hypothetical protein
MEAITQNFKDFSADLKAHPWKLLIKSDETEEDQKPEEKPEPKETKSKKRTQKQTDLQGGIIQ